MSQREKKRVGRPQNPNKIERRSTLVSDTPSQMDLLIESGHTHSEAYRLGSRILTKVKLPADIKLEEIDSMIEEAELTIQEALAKKQVLLHTKQEIVEAKELQQQEREDLENRINVATERLHIMGHYIRNDNANKKMIIDGIREMLPECDLSIFEIESFMKKGRRLPNKDSIRIFIKQRAFPR